MKFLEDFFHLKKLGTNVRTEIIAGVTTFMTMAYIIFVNPAMIAQTGMDFGAALAATCIAAAVATIMMGLYANYPIAQAPGMGENAFFTYAVCMTMGIPWQTALGCVFIEGAIFLALTMTNVRQAIIEAMPRSIRSAVAAGIGMLIAFVGLKDSGLIVAHPATFVALGDVVSLPVFVSAVGLIVTTVLLVRNVKGAMLWGILITACTAVPLGLVKYKGFLSAPPSMAPTFLKMDITGALDMGLLSVVFIFLFMDLFDTVGTLAGVGELGGFIKDGKFPRAGRAMMCDAVGTCVGAACGTPTVTSYVESASGISAGGRSGLASVVTGLLFLAALFFYPLIRMIGGGVPGTGSEPLYPITAPALVIVGCMMVRSIMNVDWKDYTEAVPAFLIMMMMPLTFSIASGIAVGFISYAAIKLLTGKGKEVSWLIYFCAVLFILRFFYLQAK